MPRSILAIAFGLGLAVDAAAQPAQPAAPPATATHKHYEPVPAAAQAGPNGELAPRLQYLGSHTFPVSTRNADGAAFINQGLNLAYAFNHAEARRAFREAARLDPDARDGLLGPGARARPNINALMEPNDEPHAYELVKKAHVARGTATPRERALIEALDQRYSGKADRARRRRPGVRRGHARRAHAVPRRPRHRDALRRVDDGPAALGLLDAGRPAARRHGRDRRAHRGRDARAIRSIRARCTCTSTWWSRRRRPRRPKPPPTRCCR